jgi:AraC-like DNA-binding protein
MDFQMIIMDNPMVTQTPTMRSKQRQMDNLRRAEGFPGQILHFIPRSILEREQHHYLLRSLCVTDIGWYPRARHHFRERPHGAGQHILIFCARGDGWYEVAGQRGAMKPRHALLIPRNTPHAYGATDANPWSIHWAHFIGEDADYYQRLLSAAAFQLPVAPACVAPLEQTFRQACASVAGGYFLHNIIYLSHALRHILGILFYHNSAYSPGQRAPQSRDLQPSINYMLDHYSTPLRLEEIARQSGLSAVHFATLFRRQTGMPPIMYFIHLRMRQACRLLDTTTLTIREIAFRIGYEDPYYFSRIFRQQLGLSPRQYRNMQKG